MADAPEVEKAEATDRLFSVIEILDRMVERLEWQAPETLPSFNVNTRTEKLGAELAEPHPPETLPLF